MIEVRGLRKLYGDRVAIHGLDLTIGRGVVVGLLGINGAGKTTTMRMLSGSLSPTQGEVFIDGHAMSTAPLSAKSALGYLPERVPLYEDMTVRQMLRYAARLKGVREPGQAVERVCRRVGLCEVGDRWVRHLSKGYRQRVGFACAILHDPKVLILDEPTSGLDPAQRVEFRRWIQELAGRGTTVVVSTHVLAEVQSVCEQVIVLHEGRVVAQDSIEGLTSGKHVIHLEVDGDQEGLETDLKAIIGVEAVRGVADGGYEVAASRDVRAEVARCAASYGLVNLSQRGQLEEVFLGLTREENS